jgi:cell division protein FtsZ
MSEMGMAMMGSGRASGENRARVAAEQAVASPLLEDVNLSGAGGVLVNITAGPDMSIGEFEEVGDVIRSFASESATVVVGTVIDLDMRDEMRVTVVVTGLGQVRPERAAPKRLESVSEGSLDYNVLDKPAVLRKQSFSPMSAGSSSYSSAPVQQTSNQPASKSVAQLVDDMDYLDIPAFLRRHES